jgi:hypothetical protein
VHNWASQDTEEKNKKEEKEGMNRRKRKLRGGDGDEVGREGKE